MMFFCYYCILAHSNYE